MCSGTHPGQRCLLELLLLGDLNFGDGDVLVLQRHNITTSLSCGSNGTFPLVRENTRWEREGTVLPVYLLQGPDAFMDRSGQAHNRVCVTATHPINTITGRPLNRPCVAKTLMEDLSFKSLVTLKDSLL